MFDNNIWNIWSVTAYSNPHALIPLKSIIKMSKLPCMKKKKTSQKDLLRLYWATLRYE